MKKTKTNESKIKHFKLIKKIITLALIVDKSSNWTVVAKRLQILFQYRYILFQPMGWIQSSARKGFILKMIFENYVLFLFFLKNRQDTLQTCKKKSPHVNSVAVLLYNLHKL